jgi:GTPase SAR1 family protein
MKDIQRPRLIVVAGPNGSGKTTITEKLLRHEWMEDCVYINPDFIAQQEFGDWNSPEAFLKAANRAKEMREDCLSSMTSMAIETVFSTQEKVDFVQRAKVAGIERGDGVEFRRFFFHLFVVMKSHATSSQNRCAGCLASYHMQGYRATKHF